MHTGQWSHRTVRGRRSGPSRRPLPRSLHRTWRGDLAESGARRKAIPPGNPARDECGAGLSTSHPDPEPPLPSVIAHPRRVLTVDRTRREGHVPGRGPAPTDSPAVSFVRCGARTATPHDQEGGRGVLLRPRAGAAPRTPDDRNSGVACEHADGAVSPQQLLAHVLRHERRVPEAQVRGLPGGGCVAVGRAR